MEFDDYLRSKKIDAEKYKAAEKDQYASFKLLFDQIHPDSFTQQKLFLINKIRRTYLLKEEKEQAAPPTPKKLKPKIVPKKPKLS